MKIKLILLSAFLLGAALIFTFTASAAIPHLMNFQGKATDKVGAPLNGTYNLTFRIYNSETDGTSKWSETQTNISISNGIFQVQLGSVTPLSLPFDESYWISIEINTDGEMYPRTRLASVGYAYTAEYSNNTGIPTGVIMAWATDTPPDGWLVCDGRAVSRATYGRLFNIIGSTYGAGDGSTTFNLPDLRSRVIVGENMSGTIGFGATARTAKPLASTAGEETHQLTIAEMPAHTHTYPGYNPGGTIRSYNVKLEFSWDPLFPSSSTGGNGAHNNLQPYITLIYIIKI